MLITGVFQSMVAIHQLSERVIPRVAHRNQLPTTIVEPVHLHDLEVARRAAATEPSGRRCWHAESNEEDQAIIHVKFNVKGTKLGASPAKSDGYLRSVLKASKAESVRQASIPEPLTLGGAGTTASSSTVLSEVPPIWVNLLRGLHSPVMSQRRSFKLSSPSSDAAQPPSGRPNTSFSLMTATAADTSTLDIADSDSLLLGSPVKAQVSLNLTDTTENADNKSLRTAHDWATTLSEAPAKFQPSSPEANPLYDPLHPFSAASQIVPILTELHELCLIWSLFTPDVSEGSPSLKTFRRICHDMDCISSFMDLLDNIDDEALIGLPIGLWEDAAPLLFKIYRSWKYIERRYPDELETVSVGDTPLPLLRAIQFKLERLHRRGELLAFSQTIKIQQPNTQPREKQARSRLLLGGSENESSSTSRSKRTKSNDTTSQQRVNGQDPGVSSPTMNEQSEPTLSLSQALETTQLATLGVLEEVLLRVVKYIDEVPQLVSHGLQLCHHELQILSDAVVYDVQLKAEELQPASSQWVRQRQERLMHAAGVVLREILDDMKILERSIQESGPGGYGVEPGEGDMQANVGDGRPDDNGGPGNAAQEGPSVQGNHDDDGEEL